MNQNNFSEISFMGLNALSFNDAEGNSRAFITLRCGEPNSQENVIKELKSLGEVISPRQVHGNKVIEATGDMAIPLRPEVDGIIITETGIVGTLQFADCFPVVIYAAAPSNCVMLLHSGFKGTVENIVRAGWDKLKEIFPDTSPENVEAWVGPGIGPCCYKRKRDEEWSMRAMSSFEPGSFSLDGEYVNFDLPSTIISQILDLGIAPEKIYLQGQCSSCKCDRFYSYRKGDKKTRMVLVAQL